jgi:hypothetical protein
MSCRLASSPQSCIQPGPDGGIQRAGVGRFKDTADGGLTGRLEPPGQRITADAQSS